MSRPQLAATAKAVQYVAKGNSISAAARKYQLDRRTVQRAIRRSSK